MEKTYGIGFSGEEKPAAYRVEQLGRLYYVLNRGKIVATFPTWKAAVEAVIAYKEGRTL